VTALHVAVASENDMLVRTLLDADAVDARRWEDASLQIGAGKSDDKVVQILLMHSADITALAKHRYFAAQDDDHLEGLGLGLQQVADLATSNGRCV
jgi:hypothetical protein